MKNKKLNLFALIALSTVLLAGAGGGIYAYWAGSVTAPANETGNGTVEIGEGKAVTTTLKVSAASETGVLVPDGRSGVGEVEYIVLTHAVEWTEDVTSPLATGHTGTLSAALVAASVEIDGSTTYASLVGITIQVGGTAPVDGGVVATASNAIILDGDAVTVYIKVTLAEPADITAYNAIATKDITFDVTYSVVPA